MQLREIAQSDIFPLLSSDPNGTNITKRIVSSLPMVQTQGLSVSDFCKFQFIDLQETARVAESLGWAKNPLSPNSARLFLQSSQLCKHDLAIRNT
jgi:hypothetical protein